jgi:hypothetical protein
MLYQDIRAAFETALYNLDNTFDTAWENDEFTPDETKPYQRVQLMLYRPENPCINTDYRRERGEFQVFVSYPKVIGSHAAYTKASSIASLFKRGTTLQQGSTKVQIHLSPYVQTAMQVYDRYVVAVTVEFYVEVFE